MYTQAVEQLVQVTSGSHSLPYVLLRPGLHLPRTGDSFQRFLTWKDLPRVHVETQKSRILAVDLETRGSDYSSDIEIVGVGLAWSTGSGYFDWCSLSSLQQSQLLLLLFNHEGLIAHNVYFDGGVLRKIGRNHMNWRACTYAMLAMLANESPERKWGLKNVMTELLGWFDSNEADLDQWLVMHGYYKGNKRANNNVNYLLTEYSLGKLHPDKGEMWRAPSDILGKYCILDAEACYLLYTEVLEPKADQFPDFVSFFHTEFMHLILVLIDQHIHGISMDTEGLAKRRAELLEEIEETTQKFLTNPEVLPHIQAMEYAMCEKLWNKQPAELKKDGTVSKNWIAWREKLDKAEAGEDSNYIFNINSGYQMAELIYERLGYPVRIRSETGKPSTAVKAMRGWGSVGIGLSERAYAVKELSYIDKYIELTSSRDTIHPSFRTPGTITGRLSSKEPNMQQISKSKSTMDLFRARPGKMWVDLDFAALEPVVATEFSQDRNMLQIYGDGVPPNDIYLYVAASVPGDIGRKVRATGYDPLHPTREALALAKKECKHERGICKTVVLACQYGAGINKIMQTLEEQDIFLDYEEVRAIHSGYWNLFSDLKRFGRDLYVKWRDNNGYILNGIGRPMCLPEEYSKDALNRFIQSTGHDILVKYVCILTRRLDEMRVDWKPLVIDFHDASAIEIPEDQLDQTIEVYKWSLDELNKQLGGTIRLKGTPSYGVTLTDLKEPES